LPGLAMSMGAIPESALDLLETHRRRIALRPDFTPRYHNAFDRTRTYYLRRLGRTAEAIALAEKIVAAVPTAPNYLLQAQIKADAGDVDGALAAYTRQLVKLDPATPDKALGTWSAMVRLCRKHAAYDRAGLLRHCDAILALYLAMPPPAGTSIALWREQWAPFIGLVSGLQAQLQTQILNAPPAAQ
jgi:tetratricopeptide (TPR) repeat protein